MANKRLKKLETKEVKTETISELKSSEVNSYLVKDKIDFLFKVIGRYDLYINATNTKASLVFAWNGFIIGTLLLKFNEIVSLFPNNSSNLLIANTIFLAIAFCAIISNVIAFQVISPSLKSSSIKSDGSSIIFFGSVASNESNDYFEKVSKISNKELLKDITDQTVTLARIADDKMQKLKKSIKILLVEFYFIVVLFLLKFLALIIIG